MTTQQTSHPSSHTTIRMPPLRPFRTLNYPITRTSNSNASFRTPILASIALYRLPPQSQSSLVQPNKSTFSTSTIRPTSNQDDQYDPPGGWFLGIPPGEKYVNEGWEPAWIWGFWGSLIVGAIAYAFKPDTS